MNTVTKQLAPMLDILRTEDPEDCNAAVVYTVDNKSNISWIFNLDYRESKNIRLEKTDDNFRRIVVPSQTTMEVSRLNVINPKLESSLKLNYSWEETTKLPDDIVDGDLGDLANFGKPVIKREALSNDVDLLTTRTDHPKNGHSKFVYCIDSRRRDSLKVILDFSGSTNLSLVNTSVHSKLASFIFGLKKTNKADKASMVCEVRVCKGTTRVAKLRTVQARQGWALNHNVTFEVRDLNPETTEIKTKEIKKKEKKMIDARGSNTKAKLPARRPTLRRISATQHTRSSAGFERGILSPMTTTLIQTPPGLTKKIPANVESVVVNEKKSDEPMLELEHINDAARMTWLDDEIFAFVNDVDSSDVDSSDVDSSKAALISGNFQSSTVEELLRKLNLDNDYYQLFVMEDFDDMVVLQGLAQSASEFRNIMKEIGVTKAGQREKILQAVLAAC